MGVELLRPMRSGSHRLGESGLSGHCSSGNVWVGIRKLVEVLAGILFQTIPRREEGAARVVTAGLRDMEAQRH